jgi:hypothetical protein
MTRIFAMKSLMVKFLLTLLSFLMLQSAFAKRFANKYCEFELPPGWECALEGSEWVCQSDNVDRKREAIIILAAKTRGEQDSLEEYQAYLNKPKSYALPGGKSQISEAKYVAKKDVNGHQWIDSLHLASEVPGFYTRYLATVKEDLGVAVTFSVAKDLYDSYKGVFDAVVASLRVFRAKTDVNKGYEIKDNQDSLADTVFINDESEKVDISNQKSKGDGKGGAGDDMTLYLIIGAVAVVGFIIAKRRKK